MCSYTQQSNYQVVKNRQLARTPWCHILMHGVAQRYLGAEFYFQCTCIDEWLCLLILCISILVEIKVICKSAYLFWRERSSEGGRRKLRHKGKDGDGRACGWMWLALTRTLVRDCLDKTSSVDQCSSDQSLHLCLENQLPAS